MARNPADDLVEIINNNRTAHKLPGLSNSPGLGCIALQYAEECQGNCTINNTIKCKPLVDDFTEVFAPNCGVELPTFATISGYIIGCHHKHLTPSETFSQLLARDEKSLSLVGNKSHTEVGVGVFGAHKHKGPYLWCILFSDGQANTTFVLDDLGKGIRQKTGCYSGTTDPCSRGSRKNERRLASSPVVSGSFRFALHLFASPCPALTFRLALLYSLFFSLRRRASLSILSHFSFPVQQAALQICNFFGFDFIEFGVFWGSLID